MPEILDYRGWNKGLILNTIYILATSFLLFQNSH